MEPIQAEGGDNHGSNRQFILQLIILLKLESRQASVDKCAPTKRVKILAWRQSCLNPAPTGQHALPLALIRQALLAPPLAGPKLRNVTDTYL